MATKRQKLFLTYFISRASLFGLGYSRMFALSANDTWISAILGMLLGIIIVCMISKILNNKRKNNVFIKTILILLCCYFISEELTSLINFMTSFFLLNTPGFIIGLCSIIVSLYVISKGLTSILRTTEILFYISIFITVITLFVLLSYIKIDHLLPILITPKNMLFKSSVIFAVYTTIPLVTILSLDNNGKDLIKMYLFNTLIIIILIISILGIFGPELTKTLRFPEYIVLKRIKLLSFIEKIESLLSITYIFDNLIMMTFSIYMIKNLLSSSIKGKISFYLILLSTYLFAIFYLNNNYINALNNYYLTPYIYFGGLLIIMFLFIRAQKKKPKLQIQRDT